MIEKRNAIDIVFNTAVYILMILILIIMIYPFLYIAVYSLSDVSKIKFPLLLWPVGLTFESYRIILENHNNQHAVLVSVARCVTAPLCMLFISGMGGYAISRKNLVWGKAIRMYLLFSMYVSAGLIPGYLLIKGLGLTNSFAVYIVPGMASIFNMILIKAYITNIPSELEESVLIDGGTEIDAYFKVILPLTLPINAAIVLFAIIGAWNSYFDVSLYNGKTKELHTLSYTLYVNLTAMQNISLEKMKEMAESGQGIRVNGHSMNMALTVVTMVPIMCVYPFLQKYFVTGLTLGAVKM